MWRRISTTSTDPERAGQHAIHAGVRRQGGAERLQPVTEGGLQVPGHGDYEGARLAGDKPTHQGKLLFRPHWDLEISVRQAGAIRARMVRAVVSQNINPGCEQA